MQPVETVLRARRVVTPEGTAARWVGVNGGRIAAVVPHDARVPAGARVVDLGGTTCCCPAWSTPTCTSTTPGAPSGRASRPPRAPPRPAASPRSSTCRSTASRRPRPSRHLETKRGRGRGQVARRRRLLGRRGARQRSRTSRPLHEAGRLRLQVLPARLRRGRVPARSTGRSSRRARGDRRASAALLIVHAEDPQADRRRPAAAGRRYADFLASRPRDAENAGHRRAASTRARATGARVHVLHLSSAPTRCR